MLDEVTDAASALTRVNQLMSYDDDEVLDGINSGLIEYFKEAGKSVYDSELIM